MLKPLPSAKSLTAELVKRLADEIESGRLLPGSRLPTEQELVAATAVSRTVVREAVAALKAKGLVVTRQGVGAFVAADAQRRPFEIDPDELQSISDVLHILELRMSIETEAAGLAAERRTDQHLAQMSQALEEVARAIERGESAVEPDFAFHRSVMLAVGNPYFVRFLDFLGHFIIPRQRVNFRHGSEAERLGYLRRIQSEHVAIFEAIRDRNAEVARRAARRHLMNSKSRYRKLAEQYATLIDRADPGKP